MTIKEIIQRRGIKEILHYTTNKGLIGILDAGKVKSRDRLQADQRLEFILKLNTPKVRDDPKWVDFVNLSISRINTDLFKISSEKWHPGSDLWWCILSFDPIILTHNGTYFTTTNNIYTGVKRNQGAVGLEALFSDMIIRWSGNIISRPRKLHESCPTCRQAEVLYPKELSTTFLQTIYVETDEKADAAYGIIGGVKHPEILVKVDPAKFQRG